MFGLQVSQGFGAWAVHCFVLKALMYMLGTSNAIPFLELMAYAGYPFCAHLHILAGAAYSGSALKYPTPLHRTKFASTISQDAAAAEDHHHGRPAHSPFILLLSAMSYDCFCMGMHGTV